MSDNVDVILTPEDIRIGIRNTLAHVGCTFDQLAEMHATGHYPTLKHRMAWAAIGHYHDDPDYMGDGE